MLLALAVGKGGSTDVNPIYVTFVIHFDLLSARSGQISQEDYEQERDNIAWLVSYFEELKGKGEEFSPKLTLEITGYFAEACREDPVCLELFQQLYAQGTHSFGVHFHRNYRISSTEWPEADQDSPEMRRRVTLDHIREVDALIAKIIGTDDPEAVRAVNHIITGHLLDLDLARQMGFDLLTGGRSEVLNLFFDHDVFNPWRPETGPGAWSLAEDLGSPWLLVPQATMLGFIGEHEVIPQGVPQEYTEGLSWGIWQDLSVPAMERKFLHLYLEWRSWKGNEDPKDEKIWAFGWHEHPHNLFADDGAYGNERNLRDEVQEFVTWLNENFISPGIARYASVEGVAQAFYGWEEAHPGESSFDYPVRERDWELYPYKLKGITRELMYAHYVREITAFRDQGVYVHELLKTDGRNWRYKNGEIVSDGPTRPIYILWGKEGGRTIDFSTVVEGDIHCTDGETGAESLWPAQGLRVTEVPIVCMESGGER